MKGLNFGLIGTGFMGKAHAIALRSVATVFPEVTAPVLACLIDNDEDKARHLAQSWSFERSSDDWRSLCSDPGIDVVDICTPNYLHKEMALAAIEEVGLLPGLCVTIVETTLGRVDPKRQRRG